VKVLVDGCVWGGAGEVLRAAGHEVESTADWPRDPGDQEVLAHAHRNDQVLITLDKDFGELAVVRRLPHAGIVRLVEISATDQGTVAVTVVGKYEQELTEGAVITVEPGRVRIRPPD
jgi:predicted nuclease of predicted toxin-antitoxin system